MRTFFRSGLTVGFATVVVSCTVIGGLRRRGKNDMSALEPQTKQKQGQEHHHIRTATRNLFLLPDPKTILEKIGTDNEKDEKGGMTQILTSDVIDPWKKELFGRLDRIRSLCGKLCRIESVEEMKEFLVPNNSADLFPTVKIDDVNCRAIMSLEEVDASDHTFPLDIPTELERYYSLSGAIELKKFSAFLKQGYLEKEANVNIWTKEEVEDQIYHAMKGTLEGSYGVKESQMLYEFLANIDVKDKSILVIGSERPWLEAILLALGAGKVTTLEYGPIESRHPQISTETPKSFREKYKSSEMEKDENLYDGVVSHSSIEHSGLGRYGDALNPWGDLLAIASAWCLTKENGFLYLGLPTGYTQDARKPGSGLIDAVEYNAHRIYGDVRWPLVTANWRQVKKADGSRLVKREGQGGTGYLFEKV